MSSPAATADVTDVAPKGGGAKKLVVIGLVALLLLGGVGGGAVWFLKKRAADAAAAEESADGEEKSAAGHAKPDPKAVPTFVALDMFTVNLADREAERYAQIGVTLEIVDAKAGDQIKNYMPAIRSNILMVLSRKTSKDLLDAEGKKLLAEEIRREAVRPLGYELEAPEPPASAAAHAEGEDGEDKPKPKKKPKKKAVEQEDVPVKRVHFSNFIIQ